MEYVYRDLGREGGEFEGLGGARGLSRRGVGMTWMQHTARDLPGGLREHGGLDGLRRRDGQSETGRTKG